MSSKSREFNLSKSKISIQIGRGVQVRRCFGVVAVILRVDLLLLSALAGKNLIELFPLIFEFADLGLFGRARNPWGRD